MACLRKGEPSTYLFLVQPKRVSTILIDAAKRIINDTDVVSDRQRFPFVFATEYGGHPPDRYLDGVIIKRSDGRNCVEARGNIFEEQYFFRLPGPATKHARPAFFGKEAAVRSPALDAQTSST